MNATHAQVCQELPPFRAIFVACIIVNIPLMEIISPLQKDLLFETAVCHSETRVVINCMTYL